MATTAAAAPVEPRVYRPQEAATYTSLSVRTLRTLAALGKIDVVRLSARRIGFLREDLDRFLAANRR